MTLPVLHKGRGVFDDSQTCMYIFTTYPLILTVTLIINYILFTDTLIKCLKSAAIDQFSSYKVVFYCKMHYTDPFYWNIRNIRFQICGIIPLL